jgi:NAD(P)-dependent dehydrogenase (short-subunit alcohol dehydrogenase family)
VTAEIGKAGWKCAALPYDVFRPAAEQLAALDVSPTHLYYFATPPIFRRKAGLFDSKRFIEFNAFYVTALFELVQTCIRLRPRGIRVFYPSSGAIDARPATMTEYCMSKAAAEVLCADLSKFVPGVQVLTRRLPRLPTDQTSSVVQVETIDPIAVMLPIVREMHR